jgi:hypothetical protein
MGRGCAVLSGTLEVDLFLLFAVLAEGGERKSLEPSRTDRLATMFTESVPALVHSLKRTIDIAEGLPSDISQFI